MYRNIPIFLPELACNHKCVFCNQQHISGVYSIPTYADVQRIIEQHLATIPAQAYIQVAFFGGSFTGLDVATQKSYLEVVQPYLRSNQIKGIRLSTRPDYITREIVEMLIDYGVEEIELGAQSTNDYVLKKSARGHTRQQIIDASQIIVSHKVKLGLQMMIGLPGDTKESALTTAQDIIDFGANSTRIYPTLVVDNTPLAAMYKAGMYKPMDLSEAVDIAKEVYKLFLKHNITVLRVGLHPSKDLQSDSFLLAGPHHYSFKELVETKIWEEIIFSKLTYNHQHIHITIPASQIQYAIGYKSENKKMLLQKFKTVTFAEDAYMQNYECAISYY